MAIENFFLQNFMAEFQGGARPNQFFCDLVVPSALKGAIPNSAAAENRFRFYAKGANLPASTIGTVPVPFRGKVFKVDGDRTFEDWTITIQNDRDFPIRNMFESWMDMIDGNVNHGHSQSINIPADFMSSGDVFQMDKKSEITKSYKFIGIWPYNMSEITLGWDANDQVEEFTVQLAVQWWESDRTRNNTGAESFSSTSGGLI